MIENSSNIQLASGSLNTAAATSTTTAKQQCTFMLSSDLNADTKPCDANRKECQNFLCPTAVFFTISASTQPEIVLFLAWTSFLLLRLHPDDHILTNAEIREQKENQALVPVNDRIPAPAPAHELRK